MRSFSDSYLTPAHVTRSTRSELARILAREDGRVHVNFCGGPECSAALRSTLGFMLAFTHISKWYVALDHVRETVLVAFVLSCAAAVLVLDVSGFSIPSTVSLSKNTISKDCVKTTESRTSVALFLAVDNAYGVKPLRRFLIIAHS